MTDRHVVRNRYYEKFRSILAAVALAGSQPIFCRTHRAPIVEVQRPGSGKPDLARLTVKELRALATKLKIPGRSKARRRADLMKLIEKAPL